MPKIAIFIPCYNVEKSIRAVLEDFTSDVLKSIDMVLAVDNCSHDQTFNILREIQQSGSELAQRLTIIKNTQNYGLGGSQKIAYQYFLDNGFTHFMIIHGDNQCPGNPLAKIFLERFTHQSDVDLIISSRFTKTSHTAQYNYLRRLGNIFFNFLTFLLTGLKISDSGAGVMFARTDILNRVPFRHLTNSFQFNPQLNILYYSDKNLKIIEVPILWRDSPDESNMKALTYCWNLLKILIHYRCAKSLRRKSGWELFSSQSQSFTPSYQFFPSEAVIRKIYT